MSDRNKARLWLPEVSNGVINPSSSTAVKFLSPYMIFFYFLLLSVVLEFVHMGHQERVIASTVKAAKSVENPLVFDFPMGLTGYLLLGSLVLLALGVLWVLFNCAKMLFKKQKFGFTGIFELIIVCLIASTTIASPGIFMSESSLARTVAKTFYLDGVDFDKETSTLTGWTDSGEVKIKVKETIDGLNQTLTMKLPEEMQIKIDLKNNIDKALKEAAAEEK